jgi:hypothetical protein
MHKPRANARGFFVAVRAPPANRIKHPLGRFGIEAAAQPKYMQS